jgi:hypothetical protein
MVPDKYLHGLSACRNRVKTTAKAYGRPPPRSNRVPAPAEIVADEPELGATWGTTRPEGVDIADWHLFAVATNG